jgi:hypothetical protein
MTFCAPANAAYTRVFILAALMLIVCDCSHAKALRGDVVIMKNGDRFTGEVKRLESGVLYVETDYSADDLTVD